MLLAQFSLETHSRGIFTVAGMLKDAGMEVIYIGNSSPEEIIEAAVQENVDVVGVSTLTGRELVLGAKLMALAGQKDIKDEKLFIMGGIFPQRDEPELIKLGFYALFGPGATREEITGSIREAVAARAKVAGKK